MSKVAMELNLTGNGSVDSADSLSAAQREALQRGVAKIVEMGAELGLSPERMIALLQGGLSVPDLLEYLGSGSRDAAETQIPELQD
ncbi:MAG: hypothetical protein WAM89_19375 [Terriglobales bacterium]